MKTLLISLASLLSAIAMAKAPTFDEAAKHTQESQTTYLATFQGADIIAWTPDENDDLSKDQLHALAAQRAVQVCQSFGYQTGIFHGVSILSPDYSEGNKKPDFAWIAVDGRMIQTTQLVQHKDQLDVPTIFGGLFLVGTMTNDHARYFKSITCAK